MIENNLSREDLELVAAMAILFNVSVVLLVFAVGLPVGLMLFVATIIQGMYFLLGDW